MKTFLAAILVWVLALTGCAWTPAQDAARVAVHTAALQQQWEYAEAIYEAHIDAVPDERRQRVEAAWETLAYLHERLAQADASSLLRDAAEARTLAALGRAAWLPLRAEAEALAEAGALTALERARLRAMDERARALDAALRDLEHSDDLQGDTLWRALRDLVPLVTLVLGVAV